MAATDADNLDKLRTLYSVILDNLITAESLGSDTISVDGVTLSVDAAYARLERLAAIPGVSPKPVFTTVSVGR